MSKCNNCNCICHCSLEEHSDTYGVCPCTACACNETVVVSKPSIIKEKVFGGVVVIDNTDDCEGCQ